MLMWGGGGDQSAVQTPFGAPVDVLNAAPHGMSVDLALAALHPFMRLWDVTRDALQRLDRWFVGPIFALDRGDVAAKIAAMRHTMEQSATVFGRPMPLLVETLRTLTVAGGAAAAAAAVAAAARSAGPDEKPAPAAPTVLPSDEALASGEVSESAYTAAVAAMFGLPRHIIKVPAAARAIAKAVDARIATFEKRQYPLIKVLCNPHLQVRGGAKRGSGGACLCLHPPPPHPSPAATPLGGDQRHRRDTHRTSLAEDAGRSGAHRRR